MARLHNWIRTVWGYFREVSGEHDYDRYRARALAQGDQPMTQEAFYLWRLGHKYSHMTRCC